MPGLTLIEIQVTAAAVPVSILAPDVAGLGSEVIVKDLSAGAATHNITITPASGQIDGSGSYAIAENNGFVRLRSDGLQWIVVAKSASGGGGSVTGSNGVTVTSGNATNDLVTGVDVAQVDAYAKTGGMILKSDDDQYVSANEDGSGTGVLTIVNQKTGDNIIQLNAAGSVLIRSTDAPQTISLQADPAKLISEFGGTGAPQSAAIANATNAADVITRVNLILAYLRLRGTVAP